MPVESQPAGSSFVKFTLMQNNLFQQGLGKMDRSEFSDWRRPFNTKQHTDPETGWWWDTVCVLSKQMIIPNLFVCTANKQTTAAPVLFGTLQISVANLNWDVHFMNLNTRWYSRNFNVSKDSRIILQVVRFDHSRTRGWSRMCIVARAEGAAVHCDTGC